MDLESQPKMVGREEELAQLKTFLDEAREGHGNTVFIAGEAGVGKTRLLEELKEYAREQGVDVLQGWSLYESLTPYMPFLDALRSGGLENLFADEAPRVEAVYLVSHSGMSIKEVIREETKLDPDIFTGMLTAVGDFVKDSLSMLTGKEKEGTLNSLGYENYRIIIESQRDIHLVVILTGRENEFLINDIKEILGNVNKQYGDTFRKWDGKEESLKGITKILDTLITSGKYDGIDYAKDNPQIKRNRLFENILLGIERHTMVNPSLLCIEDLQWTDPSSLALMHYVARNTRKCNLLILGTYRPEDVSTTKDGEVHHLIEAMQLMSREDLFQKIELERLKEEYMDIILTSILSKINFTYEFKKHIYSETEGNPFFIVSLIQMLIKENTIEKKDDIWVLTKEIHEADIPSKIRDVIVRRLNRVDKENKELLEFAAVIGEEFSSEILVQATQYDRIKILKQLRNLEQNHKLIRSIDSKYKFDHAKIKEILYGHIPSALRIEYHLIIAQSIEHLNKDNMDDVVEDLAYHYYRSRNRENALPYLIKAATKAQKDYSNEEAARFYNQVLELEVNPKERMKTFSALGEIFDIMGDYDKSKENYECALDLANEKKDIAEIKAKIGNLYQKKGEYQESIKICTDALDILDDDGSKEEALAHENIGMTYLRMGEFEKALEHLNKSLEIGKNIGDQKDIAMSFKIIGIVHYDKGEYETALEYFEKSLKIFENIGNQQGIHACLNNIGNVYSRFGENEKSLEWLQKSLDIGIKCGNLLGIGYNHSNIGNVYRNLRKYDKAIENLEKSLKISKKLNMPYLSLDAYWEMGETYFYKNDLKNAFDSCKKAYDISKKLSIRRNIAYTTNLFGRIYREKGMWEESIQNFEESIKIFIEMQNESALGDIYYEFGLMWKAKGDSYNAKEQFDKALNIYEKLNLEKQVEKVKKELQACQ